MSAVVVAAVTGTVASVAVAIAIVATATAVAAEVEPLIDIEWTKLIKQTFSSTCFL